MQRDNIWEAFKDLFPDWADRVEGYQKIGSKSIKVKIKTEKGNEKYLIFLYNDPWNWTYGSTIYRRRPKPVESNIEEVINSIKEENNNEN